MSISKTALAAAIGAALSPLVHAQSLPASQASGEQQLDPVVVTATRTARTVDDTLAPVTVLRRADIERSQATSVPELLRGMPGVSFAANGGAGKNTSLFLRGTESDHTLVLIDGIKAGSATSGGFNWQDLPVEQIDRIEIVRGPRSSLYGSEAIGGVVQIFTRRGDGAPHLNGALAGGSQNSYQGTLGFSGGDASKWYSLNLSRQRTSGFNACKGRPAPGGAGCFVFEPDDDAYRNTSVSARGGFRVDNRYELEANLLYGEGLSEFDGSSQNSSKTADNAVGARFAGQMTDIWKLSVNAGQSETRNDNYYNSAYRTSFDTRRETASVQNDIAIGSANLVTLGADIQSDNVRSSTAYPVNSRSNNGVFGQWQGDFGAHSLQASLRNDDNSQFGKKNTGGLAWGWDLLQSLRATASYGTAFKAPTFNELYFPGFGNPNLRPESSKSFEFGLDGKLSQSRWSAHVFRTDIKDLIGNDASFVPANIDKARIIGVETTASTRFGNAELGGSLTWLDPENRSSGANEGNVLPRRSQLAGRVDFDYTWGAWRFGTTLSGEGKRYDDLANTKKLGGFALLDLRGEYQLARDWRVQGKVGNVLDKQYETVQWYNQAGINWLLTLRYQPK
ncbi:TonB-dependent vitamin B12 receptor [Uliginosibacterium sp. H1]|uniref:TonB-dependent vitamin B12 receptor n=1 Tax=Uliginosibacterium sp. H1 TaxID=3114757 RepID=UPI002E19A26B|nr:TonB-dependent vitamin B12 receptor [Uliginosibacterium sp. H1]